MTSAHTFKNLQVQKIMLTKIALLILVIGASLGAGGHANITQTARYSHLSDDTLLAAADAAANATGDTWSELQKASATV
jgi:hypothetical protein